LTFFYKLLYFTNKLRGGAMMKIFGLLSLLGIGILLYFLFGRKKPADDDTIKSFETCVSDNDIETVKKILEKYDIDINKEVNEPSWLAETYKGSTALHVASSLGHYEIVKYLLTQEKIDVNKTDHSGTSAFDVAFTKKNNVEIIKLFISHKDIDVNRTDPDGLTPLSFAFVDNNEKMAKLLLQHKDIDVNKESRLVSTPLIAAINHTNEKMVKLLLQHKNIDVNQKSYAGLSPLEIAEMNGLKNIAQLLRKKGAK
jgi:ankyrin repeat protein